MFCTQCVSLTHVTMVTVCHMVIHTVVSDTRAYRDKVRNVRETTYGHQFSDITTESQGLQGLSTQCRKTLWKFRAELNKL